MFYIIFITVFNCSTVCDDLIPCMLRIKCFTNKVHLTEINLVLFVTLYTYLNLSGQREGNIITDINNIYSHLLKKIMFHYIYTKHWCRWLTLKNIFHYFTLITKSLLAINSDLRPLYQWKTLLCASAFHKKPQVHVHLSLCTSHSWTEFWVFITGCWLAV